MIQGLSKKSLRELRHDYNGAKKKHYLYLPLLSAAIAARDNEAMKLIITYALGDNIPARSIEETILQCHLFLGFPAMIEASRLYADIINPNHRIRQLPQPYKSITVKEWNRNGLTKIKKIYGSSFNRLVPYINSFSPQVLTWMINDGYGQVLSRPGLSFKLRELSIVATLMITMYENQLRAHIRGALNIGISSDMINDTINNCGYFCSKGNVRAASTILNDALKNNDA